jgi:putative endonuclease
MAGLDPAIHPCRYQQMTGFVYMLSNRKQGALYIGVTACLAGRVYQHRTAPKGFVARYGLKTLVWYEEHEQIETAIQRETSMKRWKRRWKMDLIERDNPDWRDLYAEFTA